METPSISPHISSLAASLSAVPPAAAPSIVDCVLASSALPPPLLLSSLLRAFPNLTEADHPSRALSYTGALCHLAGKTDGLAAFGDLIWRAFLPLLKRVDANDSELLNKILGFLCDALSKTQFWELAGETLVPFSLRSVGLSVGLINSGELAVYRWSREDSFEVEGTLPVMVACRVLTSLLECALRDVGGPVCLGGFAANLVWDLSTLALGMLLRSPEDRSVAVRMLLPSVFGAFTMFDLVEVSVCGSLYTLSRRCFSEKIWECSISLFSLGQIERLDAYNVLSLYFSFHHKQQNEETLVGINGKEFDITNEKEFWEELRRGLVDKDASLRKQALYILKASLTYYSSFMGRKHDQCSSFESASTADAQNAKIVSDDGATSQVGVTKRAKWAEKEAKSLGVGELSHLVGENCSSSQDRWKVFLLLYEMLEEYGTHLVEAAWNHQVFLLFQSRPLNNCSNPKTCGVYQVQMETVEGIFSWLAVLWERGFFHENPQVRCLIMQSFLDIEWDKHGNCARMVPRSFLLGPFMLGLNDVVHHKDFGVKGLYTSRAIKGATKYISKISSQLSLSERVEFVWSLASVARQESFGRAGLMALAFCIAAACRSNTVQERGTHYSVDSSHISCLESAQRDFLPVRAEDLLDVLGIVIERSKQHFNPNYRLQVCAQVLGAASSVLSIFDVPLDMLLHFLATVPREFTDHAGPLREIVQHWLTQISFKDKSPGLMTYENSEAQVLENLISFPTCFIKHNNSPDGSISFDDEDVDAWIVGAQRWSRVLFLAIREAQYLEPIIMFFQNHCSSFCKQESKRDWVPVKVIILLLCLVEEFQVECANATFCSEKKAGRESGRTRILDQSCPLITSVDCDKFIKSFSSILVDLLSFAKLVSPIFWSVSMVKDTLLPGSVKGKLGGPSQRRLPSYTTASVLQAILSLRTVACISSWCSEQRRHDCNDSSFPFLWEFTWKVIQSQSYNSETSAELCLAAYEALASVLKGLSTAFTPLVFNFIFAYNRSKFFNGEDRPLLDPLTLAFFNNINDILSNGKLTRSRRAVLMSWKWNCLASLLLVPYNYIENGVHARNSFFSDSTLRRTFADTVESLENAGESSVLFILRAVRLVLGLLCSGKTSSMIACSGVDCQMMLQLVRSSWVLHLSCNKRRVASIAALLSAVLHESVFSDMTMHETNGGEQGPLKWFIENLLAEGVKSPRTIRLAALHLTGLWLLHPKTVKYYIKELKLLALYGSVAFDEDFAAELSENHEARTEVSLLAQSPDRELTEVFINTELYARVSVAALFYKLAGLANNKREQENEDSVAALHCGKMFLLEMLDTAANDKDLAKELYKKYSAVHRRKVRAWQMICILSHFVEKDILKEVTSNMHICLYKNNLPAVRQYLETFAIQVYLKFPTLAEAELVPIFYNYNMRPQALSSYVFIAANLILHASDLPVQIKHFNVLLPPIFPFLTSHHHSLRAFTQLLVHHILCKLWHVFEPITSEIAPLEKKCFVALKSYLTENSDCFRLRASMEGFLYAFDPKTSATPAGTFDARNEGSEFECVPVSLMEQVINFLNEARDDLRHSIVKDAMTIKNESLMVAYACEDRKKASQTPKDISLDFQKKITLNEHVRQGLNIGNDCFLGNAELSKLLSEMEKEDELLNSAMQSRNQALEMIRGSQQQFILVASLIDRIPNLAGLARTCEVFKAAGLAVADSSIIQDKQFQLISVTAEKWVPMIEVPVCSLKVFLEKKRREGYSILGLEQTANSIPLDKYSFPNKMVLVLGREKEGIPVDIIHVLDACIEIPQLGIVRSLNVHVSGAIALWEYTRQQRSKQL